MGKVMRKSSNQFLSRMAVIRSPLPTPHSLLILLLLLLFLSCKSAPNVFDAHSAETTIPLDTGALAYVFADVKKARPILDLLPLEELNNKQTKQMIEKTDFFAAALFLPESGRRFQIAAWGNYPSLRANMALSFNKKWKKQSGGTGSYWYSAEDKLSIALDSRQAFAASWLDKISDPLASAPGIKAPEGFGELGRGTVLSCWLNDPAHTINKKLEEIGIPFDIPAEKILIGIFPVHKDTEPVRYEARLRIDLHSGGQARALAMLLLFANNVLSFEKDAGVLSVIRAFLFANPPVQDGRSLDIKTDLLSEAEIALLFSLFLKK